MYMYIENVCYISYLHQIIFYDDFQLIVFVFFIVLTCEMLFALHFVVFFFFYVAKDAVNGLDFYLRIIKLFFIDTYGVCYYWYCSYICFRHERQSYRFIFIYHLLFMLRKVVLETCGLFGRIYIYQITSIHFNNF